MKVKQAPRAGKLVYIKNAITDRVVLVDKIEYVTLSRFETKCGLIFDFWGEPCGSTANNYGNCVGILCTEEEEEFCNRLYESEKNKRK